MVVKWMWLFKSLEQNLVVVILGCGGVVLCCVVVVPVDLNIEE